MLRINLFSTLHQGIDLKYYHAQSQSPISWGGGVLPL